MGASKERGFATPSGFRQVHRRISRANGTDGSAEPSLLAPGDNPVLANAVEVAAGYEFTCALLKDHTIKCWGRNDEGEIGDGTKDNSDSPLPVPGITTAVHIAAGAFHSCAVLSNGTAMCWGDNYSGALGNGDLRRDHNPFAPVLVKNLDHLVGIAAGAYHTCALKDDCTSYCWGDGDYGELGDGAKVTDATALPTPVVNSDTTPLDNAVQLAAGGNYTCVVLRNSGTVKCWGALTGQDSVSTPTAINGLGSATQVSVGGSHACTVTPGGDVKCWGSSQFGACGGGATDFGSFVISPVVVGGALSGVTQIDTGEGDVFPTANDHSCAIISGIPNTVKCWGYASAGQLGNGGTTMFLVTPVKVAGFP